MDAAHPNQLPVVEPLSADLDAEEVFLRLAGKPHCLFLDSALAHEELGRYSFLMCDPFEFLEFRDPDTDPLEQLRKRMQRFSAPTREDLPPLQGGAAGLFSYDLGRTLEKLPAPACDEFQVPLLAVGLYDVVVAFDHHARRAWIISQGFPETDADRRLRRAEQRAQQFRNWIEQPIAADGWQPKPSPEDIDASRLAKQHTFADKPGLTSNLSAEAYQAAVERAIRYIHAGDVFQVNFAQRLLHPATTDPISLYRRLRTRNAAPFAGFFDLGRFQICSASPERFLRVADREVEARPIKGTHGRTPQPEADLFSGDVLRESEKDRAENVMIVDLMRNDLSRTCEADSVRVAQLCGLETYAYVRHLVSVVRGTLRADCTPLDCLRAAFPGGSITGAPKVRAIEIIAELEPTARGAYCGSLGYLGFNGSMDTSILIRTITAGRGWWQLPVGGGIVAQSNPAREYEETWHKAEGMIRALHE